MQAYLCFKPDMPPERRSFGALITIDDAVLVPAAKGFGFHPHNDVEVVTFVVKGEVNHIDPNDSSHNGLLKAKGIQIITAGTGIVHNELNNSDSEEMHALQIWFTPREKNLKPGFSRKHISSGNYEDRVTCVLSPDGADGSLLIQQDVYLNYGNFRNPSELHFKPRLKGNHAFFYVIDGQMSVLGQTLTKGDGFGIRDSEEARLDISRGCEFLAFDVPG